MAECRLRVKIGPYELEAEGPREFVEKHYGSFSERIPANTEMVPVSLPPPGTSTAAGNSSIFASIFHHDGKLLSLTARPPGDNSELDGVLLILLGHKELNGADLVSADELVNGLKQSGYPIERADRIVSRGVEQGLVMKSGVRRGTRYRLTNQGATRARLVGTNLLETVG